ncbi:hypothetical protein Hanom_Chr00s003719g01715361 [Helianthus anomalus]
MCVLKASKEPVVVGDSDTLAALLKRWSFDQSLLFGHLKGPLELQLNQHFQQELVLYNCSLYARHGNHRVCQAQQP